MAQKATGMESYLQENMVVDIDVHFTYRSPDLSRSIADRMDEPYRRYTHPDYGNGAAYPSGGWAKDLGGQKNTSVAQVFKPEHINGPLCEGLGVDYPLVNSFALLDHVKRTNRAIEEGKAVNDYLLEEVLDGNENFFGLISVPTRKPEAAAEEIDRLGDEKQVVGVFIPTGAPFQKPLGDPSHDVMYQAMEDRGLTPMFHTGAISYRSRILDELETYFAVHTLSPVWSGSLTLASLIAQGTPEKFPDLNFALVEYGIAWLPYFIARLNREYGQWRSEVPLLKKSPEEYIRDQFYVGTQPLGEFNDHRHLQNVVEILGPEMLMFATDYPHHDFDDPAGITLPRILSDEDRNRLFSRNAIECFDLPL